MKNPLSIALIALVLSLVALGSVMLAGPSPAAGQATDAAPSAGPSGAELLAMIEDLVTDNEALHLEVERLAMALSIQAPAVDRVAVGQGSLGDAELDSLVEKVRTALEAQPKGVVPPAVDFDEQVATSLKTIKRDEATRKADARQASRSAKLTHQMPVAVEKLGLSVNQEVELHDAISEWYLAEAQMAVMWAEEGASEELGAFKGDSYGNLETSLGLILSPQQLVDYAGLDGSTFPGAGWPGK